MTNLGDKLRAARIERGITLEAIAEETKISLRYLKAIETIDPAGLPGTVFARNFTRQYANHIGLGKLNLTASELDEQIQAAFPRVEEVFPATVPPTSGSPINPIQVAPLAEAWNWNKIGLSALGLLAVLGAGAAIFRVWQEAPSLIDAAREQARQAQQEPARPVVQRTPVTQVTQQTVPVSAPQVQIEQNNVPGAVAGGTPTSETTITISGNGMAVRVVAEQETWVSMTANGRTVFAELLKANQSRTISGVENAQLVVGNAGGVKIATNGKDIGPIGLPGQVRTVTLSPEGPKVGPGPLL